MITQINRVKNQYLADRATQQEAQNNINKLKVRLDDLNIEFNKFSATTDFLTLVSEFSRTRVTQHFEQFVTYVLKATLGDNYNFRIEWDNKGSSPVAAFKVETNYGDEILKSDPLYSKGGGVLDVLSFGVRLAFLMLLNNKGTVFLDEAFSQASEGIIPRLSALLNELGEKFGYQFIFITHAKDSEFVKESKKVLSVHLDNNASVVKEVNYV